jgi:hypothetical protein
LIEGVSAESVAAELFQSISRLLESRLPAADLWRAFSCNNFTEIDKIKLAEARAHCTHLPFKAGLDRTSNRVAPATVNIWFTPESIQDHFDTSEVPILSVLSDRLIYLRVSPW